MLPKQTSSKPGEAKVRPSKDFLRPLCQILDAKLCYLWHINVLNTLNLHQLCELCVKNKAKNFLRPTIQYFIILMKFGPSEKKSGHPCSKL